MTYNKEWAHIFIPTAIYTRANGKMVSQTDREIIFIKVAKLFIRAIGTKLKNKDLDN